jgi:hypothetical protein
MPREDDGALDDGVHDGPYYLPPSCQRSQLEVQEGVIHQGKAPSGLKTENPGQRGPGPSWQCFASLLGWKAQWVSTDAVTTLTSRPQVRLMGKLSALDQWNRLEPVKAPAIIEHVCRFNSLRHSDHDLCDEPGLPGSHIRTQSIDGPFVDQLARLGDVDGHRVEDAIGGEFQHTWHYLAAAPCLDCGATANSRQGSERGRGR